MTLKGHTTVLLGLFIVHQQRLSFHRHTLKACYLAGIGTFQSRTPDIPYTLIPGDVASSIIVASMAATAAGQGNQEGPNITQACTSCSNPITLRQLTDEICQYYRLGSL